MKKLLSVIGTLLFGASSFMPTILIAQKTCTSNPVTITSDINFGVISWTATGGATGTDCDNMADGLITFVGNVVIDFQNNTTVTISNDVTIDGNFILTGGPGSTLQVSGGGTPTTLYVTGDLGDAATNGIEYSVPLTTDNIQVDGTLYGKNNTAFTGDGVISGSAINVKNGTTCGSPCPVTGNFDSCFQGAGTFCTDNAVLPIELLSFSAYDSNGDVILEWSTASEENNDYYSIERSQDGINYSLIATVPGAGTSTSLLEYFHTDENPLLGRSYYRLKQTDFDGASETFNPITVDFTSLAEGELNFGPNPVKRGEKITIETQADNKEILKISVYNMLGEVVLSNKFSGSTFEFNIDETTRPGIYFVEISSVKSQKRGRLLVQ
jgi:hypothetical protein